MENTYANTNVFVTGQYQPIISAKRYIGWALMQMKPKIWMNFQKFIKREHEWKSVSIHYCCVSNSSLSFLLNRMGAWGFRNDRVVRGNGKLLEFLVKQRFRVVALRRHAANTPNYRNWKDIKTLSFIHCTIHVPRWTDETWRWEPGCSSDVTLAVSHLAEYTAQ